MQTIVECVPNFSEGRNRETVEQIVEIMETVPEVLALDLHLDPDHHRSVITLVGSKETVGEAAVRAVGRAAERIDMNRHRGEHPRIGAADVVPFVPVQGVTLEECAAIAHTTGEEIFRRFQIPVYFYGAAALRPERVQIENLRRGGYERLKELGLDDPSRKPDVGEPRLHPTAGATIVGARKFLIAFNVHLDSADRGAAEQIARAVRASGGGLPAVKAMGVLLQSRNRSAQAGQALLSQGFGGQAQVSMNLTDFEQTSLVQAYRAVKQEASRLRITIHSSEIVGLVPKAALARVRLEELKLVRFGPQMILENRLEAMLARRGAR